MVAQKPELWLRWGMQKSKAIELLGGTTASAAKTLGVTYQAVAKWPDELPPGVVDRLIAFYVRNRKRMPSELLAAAPKQAA